MSNNVVSLFGQKEKAMQPSLKPTNINELIMSIIDWAYNEGIDVEKDVSFHTRLEDFSRNLKLMAENNRKQKIA